jgi:hypothetical protein
MGSRMPVMELSTDPGARFRNELLADARRAAPYTLLVIGFGMTGAVADEIDHFGVRLLLSLCASGPIPLGGAILLEFQLLPRMFMAMTAGMALIVGLQVLHRYRREGEQPHPGAAAAHIGCMAAMSSSFAICSALLKGAPGLLRGAVVMAGTDAAVSVGISVAAAFILRRTLCGRPTPPLPILLNLIGFSPAHGARGRASANPGGRLLKIKAPDLYGGKKHPTLAGSL